MTKRRSHWLKKSLKRLAYSAMVVRLVNYTKHLVFPAYDNVSLFHISDYFFTGIHRGHIITRAQSLAFSFFMAFFPAIIFLFSVIPYVPIQNFQDQLLLLIKDFLPGNAYEASRETIEDIIKHQHGSLLSLGFVFALYFTTNGIMALMRSFNSSYHAQEKRSPVKQRTVAFVLTLILSVLLIVATTLIIFSESAFKFLAKNHILKNKTQLTLLLFGKWAVVLALFFIGISFLYYYAPAVKKRWRFVSAGSTFATALTLLASIGFAYFVNHFGQYNKVYGSIGTLIVIMLWIYFNSLILLLGFELNASIDRAKKEVTVLLSSDEANTRDGKPSSSGVLRRF